MQLKRFFSFGKDPRSLEYNKECAVRFWVGWNYDTFRDAHTCYVKIWGGEEVFHIMFAGEFNIGQEGNFAHDR